MMTDLRISAATESDLDEVVSWIGSEQECLTWAGPMVSYPIEKLQLMNEIGFSSENARVCRAGQELMAFGQVFPRGENGSHLARIITNPEFRGQGFGRSLCESLIHHAQAQYGPTVSLNVYRANKRAFQLYLSLGFGEQPEHSDENIVFMCKVVAL